MNALAVAALCAGLASSVIVIWDRLGKWRSKRKTEATTELWKRAAAEQQRFGKN